MKSRIAWPYDASRLTWRINSGVGWFARSFVAIPSRSAFRVSWTARTAAMNG